ncbi:unnamed protein product [Cylicostephanus goldi]|uniref:Ammonium transporter AmtB-like domain-containing protein n=1 Tax=Cylicostephanus goldi TaxID=71465 RepID=A0A3P6S7C6_CYLGO|nr:unnamed protein product [Cylicostephanus goldi]
MVHIANSTLAGGVAIGSVANVVLEPLHAMLMGVAAGALSVVGYKYITVCSYMPKSVKKHKGLICSFKPTLSSKYGCHDTCGVNNLHGMPGVFAGLMSAFFVVAYDPARYGKRCFLVQEQKKVEIEVLR